MRKRKPKRDDPRLQTPPGHYLKNAPWRREAIPEANPPMISARESIVLAFLIISSVAVAAALWMNPPQLLQFKATQAAQAQAALASRRVQPPVSTLGYDPAKFEEVKDDDPIIQDDLEDVLLEDETIAEDKPSQSL